MYAILKNQPIKITWDHDKKSKEEDKKHWA
jgi:hypothetical protein